MLDDTYSGLQASVADFLNRADLAATIPDFIVLAEAQMARRFVSRSNQGMPIPRRLVTRVDVSLSLNAQYADAPADFQGPISLTLPLSPIRELDYLDSENLQRQRTLNVTVFSPYGVVTGPRYYSVVGEELEVWPVADQAYTAELTYIARVSALSDAAPTNWILAAYPDAYLYGALTASAPYLKDDSRVQVWGTLFTAAIDDICNADPMPTDKAILRTDVPRRLFALNSGLTTF